MSIFPPAIVQTQITVEQEADRLWQQGVERYDALDLDGAIALWLQALPLYQQQQVPEKEAQVLANLGRAYGQQQDYDSAIARWQQFLALVEKNNQPKLALQGLQQLGVLFQEVGNSAKAIEFHQRSLALSRELGDFAATALALGNLGLAYKTAGQYWQAFEFYQQSLALLRELGNRDREAKVLVNLGNVYEALGQYEEASESYRQSLGLARSLGDSRGESLTLGSLGAIYHNLGEEDKALTYLRKSLAISQREGDRLSAAHSLNNLGTTYHAQGNLTEAIASHQQSLDLAQALNQPLLVSLNLSNLGLLYASQGEIERGIAAHQQSIAITQTRNTPKEEAIARNNFAHTLLNAGQLQAAETQLREALERLDSLRTQLRDRDRISLFDTQTFSYNLLQQVLVAQNRPEAALEASERSRSRAFATLLARSNPDPTAAFSAQIEAPNLAEIQHIAKTQNATLVEYSIIPADFLHRGKLQGNASKLFIWVVKPTGEVAFEQVDLSGQGQNAQNFAALTRETRRLLLSPSRQSAAQKQLQQAYQLLVQPIAQHLPTDPQSPVIFVPQDHLFLLPFPALRDAQGDYLIDKHTIATSPSIQVLQLTQQSQVGGGENLIVGNPTMPQLPSSDVPLLPLPGSEKEAQAIAQLLDTKPLLGDKATESAIASRMPNASIIHLATHGLLEDFGFGIPGALALAPSLPSDGFLTSGEIFQMSLQADLVILSACDTGKGEITGDGVIGLSRSFLTAGAASVVVSLWKVPDEPSAELMIEFYHQLQSGRYSKAQALRQAMLKTKQTHATPRSWAAFTFIGARSSNIEH